MRFTRDELGLISEALDRQAAWVNRTKTLNNHEKIAAIVEIENLEFRLALARPAESYADVETER